MKVAIVSALVVAGFVLAPAFEGTVQAALRCGQEGYGIGDPKLEYRMRIARANAEHEKMHDAADEIGRLSLELSQKITRGETLEADDAKVLDRIKRLAKRLRSDLGGGGEVTLTEKPTVVRDAVLALGANGAEFSKLFSRSTRFVVDARIIRIAGEIVVLADFLKPYAR